jgi:hypothetical protein
VAVADGPAADAPARDGEEAFMQIRRLMHRRGSRLVLAAAVSLGLAQSALSAAVPPAAETFASPEAAAAALADATRAHDDAKLQVIFGPGNEKLLSSGDRIADQEQQRRFAAAYDEKHTLVPEGTGQIVLSVGNNDWPTPIPIVQAGGGWQFDTKVGAEEIINRRIGRNELAAIRVALTFVDAQKDYSERMKQQGGSGFYAQRMISTPGRQDGLYWPVTVGSDESPFGPLVAQAEEEGYPGGTSAGKPIPYQGYYFHILKAQGPNASGGAKSYVKSGKMTDGFALIAWPASFGSSGVMTFEVNQDGIVFQKDLGTATGKLAPRISTFDPDITWARVDVTNR